MPSFSRRRSAGARQATRPTVSSVMPPPKTTDGTTRGAALEGAQLVGGADEEAVHRRHPAHLLLRRPELDQRAAQDDRDPIEGTADGQQEPGERVGGREGEGDPGEAEPGHAPEERPTGPSELAEASQGERHQDRPERRGGPQEAEPDLLDVQHVLGEDRQERGGAAEEDGEEVEAERAQEHRLREDEAHAVGEPLHQAAGRRGGARAWLHRQEEQEAERRERHHHRVGDPRAAQRDEPAADGRPEHHGGVEEGGAPGGGVLVVLPRHELAAERCRGGAEEGPAQAGQRLGAVEGKGARGRAEAEDQEQEAARRHGRQAGDGEGAPVHPVGGPAAHQRERQERDRLGQPDQAEGQRVAGQLVDLPAEHRALDLGGHEDRHHARQEGPVLREAEGGVGIVRHGRGMVRPGPCRVKPARRRGAGRGAPCVAPARTPP